MHWQGWWDTVQGAPLVRVSDPGLAFPGGRWLVLSEDGTRCASPLQLDLKPITWVLRGSDVRDALPFTDGAGVVASLSL